jgi:inorganic pyrophosphatase
MRYDTAFWEYLEKLVNENEIILDRPKGSRHPRYHDMVYETDYGYLQNTRAMDGGGIDVFKGSLTNRSVDTILCTIDLLKKDAEIKILIGCTELEKKNIYNQLNNSESMRAIMLKKEVPHNITEKEIVELPTDYPFDEIYEVFEDVVYKPTTEAVQKILDAYNHDEARTLFGYIVNGKLTGIIGVKDHQEYIEILHFGVHPQYRSNHFGTELMDYIKGKHKRMTLTTDDDAIRFYTDYGFTASEYYEEKNGERFKRYRCEYIVCNKLK